MGTEDDYAREVAERFLYALDELWAATDYPEWRDLTRYTEQELKAVLGQWIHVRKACNAVFEAIRKNYPELPGWDPIGGERSVAQRLTEAEAPPAQLSIE